MQLLWHGARWVALAAELGAVPAMVRGAAIAAPEPTPPEAQEAGQHPALELLPPGGSLPSPPPGGPGPDLLLQPTDLPLGGLPDLLPEGAKPDSPRAATPLGPDDPRELGAPGADAAAGPRDPRTAAAELFAGQALRHARAGDLSLALARIENAIQMAPRDFRLYISLGNLLVRAGRIGDARRAYEAALLAAPQSQLAACNYATALAAQGHLIRALYVLTVADERRPGHQLTRVNLGSVHALLGNDEQAVAVWSELAAEAPGLVRKALEDPLLIEALRRPRLSAFRHELTAGRVLAGTEAATGAHGDPSSHAVPAHDTVSP